MTEEELIIHPGEWHLRYRHTAGEILSRFFRELRDNQRIMGIRCPSCKRVLVTPRRFCERCFVPTTEWVQVSSEGLLQAFTIQYAPMKGLPEVPYCIAYIKLHGADTSLLHHIGGIDLSDVKQAVSAIKIRMALKAKWKERREGKITDIEYFEPI